MAFKNNSLVIEIKENNLIKFYLQEMSGEIKREEVAAEGLIFSDDFFASFGQIVSDFLASFTFTKNDQVSVVLPDCAIFTNTFSIPTLQASDNKVSFESTVTNNYVNEKELTYFTYKLEANKQYNTICLVGTKKKILENLRKVLLDAKVLAPAITFASSAVLTGASSDQSRYSKDSYIFLDIKENSAKYILVNKGRLISFFGLPIGYSALTTAKAQEEVLLFSPIAHLAVSNARIIAKKAAMSVSKSENAASFASSEEEQEENNMFSLNKNLPTPSVRRLPDFMQRSIPEGDQKMIAENFRLFVKWALNLLSGNPKLIEAIKPQTIYVNMPQEFENVLDTINEEEKENNVKFAYAGLTKLEDNMLDLESVGGLIAKISKQSINF